MIFLLLNPTFQENMTVVAALLQDAIFPIIAKLFVSVGAYFFSAVSFRY